MVQEALSNVRKHAGATRVDLLVHRHPRWRFEVQDNGQGFDIAAVPPDSLHVGLGIMRERAHRVGAVLQVESAPDQGTRVCIELPTGAATVADLPAAPPPAAWTSAAIGPRPSTTTPGAVPVAAPAL